MRDALVYSAKWVAAHALSISDPGMRRGLKALGNQAVVLAYHRVLPRGADTCSHPGIVVTPATFERHMRLLRRDFRILSLQEFEAHVVTRTPFEPGSCLVTFDDGWIDFFTAAWPILRRFDVPAVVYLPTKLIGSNGTFWQEHLSRLLCEAAAVFRHERSFGPPLMDALRASHLDPLCDAVTTGDRFTILDGVRGQKLNLAADPWSAITRLSNLLGPRALTEHGDRFMSWDQIRELAGAGVAFGVHGHTHRILSTLSAREVSDELTTARSILERELGTRVTSMSYPNGGWTEEVATLVRTLGFTIGFSMDRGPTRVDAPAWSMSRVNIHEAVTADDAFLRARLLGVF